MSGLVRDHQNAIDFAIRFSRFALLCRRFDCLVFEHSCDTTAMCRAAETVECAARPQTTVRVAKVVQLSKECSWFVENRRGDR